MKKIPRAELKEHFQQGKMPTQEDFADLIDSMLNMLDEGFDKSPEDGLKVEQLQGGKLLSFYKDINIGEALWSLELDKASNSLSFQNGQAQPLLTLSSTTDSDKIQRTLVGIRQNNPKYELDVVGTVASNARVGRSGELAVPADSNWYDITDFMTGCQAWEVMAGAGAKDSEGRYAVMHAFAMNAFGSGSGEITYHQAHFGNKCSRIELRWLRDEQDRFSFKLQMRVGCSYGDKVWIKYHMTQLWQDTLMLDSDKQPQRQPSPQYDVKGKVRN
jgi:hypothetical protein